MNMVKPTIKPREDAATAGWKALFETFNGALDAMVAFSPCTPSREQVLTREERDTRGIPSGQLQDDWWQSEWLQEPLEPPKIIDYRKNREENEPEKTGNIPIIPPVIPQCQH